MVGQPVAPPPVAPPPVAPPPVAMPVACAPVTTAPPTAARAAARDARARRKQKLAAKKKKPSTAGTKGHYPERATRAKQSKRIGGRFAKPSCCFISVTEFEQ